MEINSLQFGILEIEEKDIYTFPQGIPGFEEYHRYIFIQPEENIPFTSMQSVDEGGLAFILTNPFLFYPDYEFDLSDTIIEELGIEDVSRDAMICSIVSVSRDINDATLNLMAPVIVNTKLRQGKQIILHDSLYKTKHYLDFGKSKETRQNKG